MRYLFISSLMISSTLLVTYPQQLPAEERVLKEATLIDPNYNKEQFLDSAQKALKQSEEKLSAAIQKMGSVEAISPVARPEVQLLSTTFEVKQRLFVVYKDAPELQYTPFREYFLKFLNQDYLTSVDLAQFNKYFNDATNSLLAIKKQEKKPASDEK